MSVELISVYVWKAESLIQAATSFQFQRAGMHRARLELFLPGDASVSQNLY